MHWEAAGHAPEQVQARTAERARAGGQAEAEPGACDHFWVYKFKVQDQVQVAPALPEAPATCGNCGDTRVGSLDPVVNATAQRRRAKFRVIHGGRL